MYSYVNKPTIIKYFTILKNMPIDFSELANDAEALENINKYIELKKNYFYNEAIGKKTLLTLLCEKLITSPKCYGINNYNESAYFFINIYDPKLKLLKIYESVCNTEDLKYNVARYFSFYDEEVIKSIIVLEKLYNKTFQIYNLNELLLDDIKQKR